MNELKVQLINETTSNIFELWTGGLSCHLANCGIYVDDYTDEFIEIRFCDSYKIIVNENHVDINDKACAYVYPSKNLFEDESISIEITIRTLFI